MPGHARSDQPGPLGRAAQLQQEHAGPLGALSLACWVACRKETHCEFCDSALPDWKQTLTPTCGANAPAVMNVNFDGRTYSFEVKPGPDGYRQFTEAIRRAFNLPEDSELNITFTCDEPSTQWEAEPAPSARPALTQPRVIVSHRALLRTCCAGCGGPACAGPRAGPRQRRPGAGWPAGRAAPGTAAGSAASGQRVCRCTARAWLQGCHRVAEVGGVHVWGLLH